MRTVKVVTALVLFAVAFTLFLKLVDSVALVSGLVILGVMGVAGITLAFTGLPGPSRKREH